MKQLCRAALVSVGCALLSAPSSFAAVTDLGDFSLKVAFTIDYDGADTLSGIPVLVKLAPNSPAGFSYADCAADGSDLRFAIEGGSALPFEIDTWNPSGESIVWVKVPAVTRGTKFMLYYKGTPSSVNVPSDVWTEYSGVWHLGTLGTDTTPNSQGLYANSTAATGIDAHLSSQSIPGEAGKFGQAFRPNDSTGCKLGNYNEGGAWVVDAGEDSPIDSANGKMMISGWIKHQNWNNVADKIFYKRLLSNGKEDADTPTGAFVVEAQGAPNFSLTMKGSGDNRNRIDAAQGANVKDAWVYVTAVFDGKTHTLYENGGQYKQVGNYLSVVTDNDAPLVFGNTVTIADGETGSNAWNGWIDEVRFVKGVKSAEWIAAEYAAMASDTFLSAGNVQDADSETVQPPSIGSVSIVPEITGATISGTISELGTDMSSCDVYLAIGAQPETLGVSVKIAEGVTTDFTYELTGLSERTTYYYEIVAANPVGTHLASSRRGQFTTKSDFSRPLNPQSTPAETRAFLQAALDAAAAASPAGAVTLGEGVFEVDAELFVTNGVQLVGQGWKRTVLRQTTAIHSDQTHRVVSLKDGASLRGVTVTGGNADQNHAAGGGVSVSGPGTISWCCVTNNCTRRGSGGGIYIGGVGSVTVDHTIVGENLAGVSMLDGWGGGLCIRGESTKKLNVTIDACLFYGNVAGDTGRATPGGAIAIHNPGDVTTTIRNTTVADNRVVGAGTGGGLYVEGSASGTGSTSLVNCIFANNTAEVGDGNVAFSLETIAAKVAEKTTNCLFGNGTTPVGANPVSGDPLFKNAAAHDYRLTNRSPAIGRGVVCEGLPKDLNNKSFGKHPAIGCYATNGGLVIRFR